MNVNEKAFLDSKILIVDDELANVMLLEQMLENADYQHIYSTTEPSKVTSLQQQHDFDLILLDINMPVMNGFQVMQALALNTSNDYLPVLVLTAQTDDTTRSKALSLGAKDFLTKPFKIWEVLLRIQNMLEMRFFYKQQLQRAQDLESKVAKRTQEIKETQLETLECLARAGEYRDNETGAHVFRMSRSCHLLALAYGLTKPHAEMILYATPMHDIGKIGIPDHILLKQGKLTQQERLIINSHARIGAEIIGEHSSEILQMSKSIAFCHHEKWDGSGYPRGLKGNDIPIESRIAAICDVFDALISERPYKKAWPIEKALAYINEESGKHFDPKLVEHFNQILPDISALSEEFPDKEQYTLEHL